MTVENASVANVSEVQADLPTCKCGNNRHHYRVSREGEYTTWGWILLMSGISVKALKVNFRCRACNQVFDASTDERDLRKRS